MADNVAITAGSGTTVATDDIGGVQYQRVKLGLGADGTAVDAVGGSGANGTGVQRVTIATDDTLMAAMSAKLPTALGAGGGLKVQMYNAAGSNVDPVAAGTAVMSASVPTTIATDDTIHLALLAAMRGRVVQVVPTVDATACAQYDVWAATEVITNACAAVDIPACLRSITAVRLDSATGLDFRVWLLSKNSSVGSENAAFAPADADADDLIGYVDFAVADFVGPTGMVNCFAQRPPRDVSGNPIDLWCTPASGTKNVYFAIQVLAAGGIDVGAATDLILTFQFI
jgi:hypothetical protein